MAVLVLVAAAAFEILCLVQVVEAPAVRHLPRWLWGVLCVCCNPLGGIAFLVLGWQRRA